MKQINDIRIDSPIIPNKGIGELKLGMNSFYIRDFYEKNFQNDQGAYSSEFDKNFWESKLWEPFFGNVDLIYNNFINITINLYSGAISHLRVKNNYKGKVDGMVGIGDSLRNYYHLNSDNFSEFEDGVFFFWFDNRFGLSFFVGNNLEDFPNEELFDKYLDIPIMEIEILDDEQRIAIGADLPDKWKK